MTRYRFPADRAAFIYGTDYSPILTPPRTPIIIYTDQAATTLADIQTLGGISIALSTVYTDHGVIPEFLGPDAVTRLWAVPAGGIAAPLDAEALSVLDGLGVTDTGQLRASGTASMTLSGHRVVTQGSDGRLGYASNDNPAMVQSPLWITMGAASSGAAVEVVMFGALIEPSWSWTPGPLYLGAAGALTQTPPSALAGAAFLAQIGVANGATSVFIDRGPSILLS
jgi:hypothetical protein